jgi:lysophospholipase L1-like esterase
MRRNSWIGQFSRGLLTALCSTTLLAAAPSWWASDINKFTEADAAHPPPRDAVLFIGSSSILKWTTLAADFPDTTVINRGFGGSELADSVYYADRIAIPYHPRLVVLYAGDNDLLAGKTPETVFADFKAFAAKIHAGLPEARLIYIAIKPSPSRWQLREKIVRANTLIAEECRRDSRATFLDVYSPMLDPKGQPRPELFVPDMLHLNAEGYALWKKLLAPLLKP